MVSIFCLFSPRRLGKGSNLTNIFQRDSNHQLDVYRDYHKQSVRVLIKQPGFNRKYTPGRFFRPEPENTGPLGFQEKHLNQPSFSGSMLILGGAFKYSLCSPLKLGKMNPFWRSYLSNGLVKNHHLVILGGCNQFFFAWLIWFKSLKLDPFSN